MKFGIFFELSVPRPLTRANLARVTRDGGDALRRYLCDPNVPALQGTERVG